MHTTRVALLGLSFALLAAPRTHAQEEKLPFNPLEKARKNDWAVLKGTLKDAKDGKTTPCALLVRVVQAHAKEVALDRTLQSGGVSTHYRKLPSAVAPPIEALLSFAVMGTPAEVKWSDEKRTIAGTEFACKKAVFTAKTGFSTEDVTAWFSPDVKAGGLVALSMHLKTEEGERDTTLELAGHGSGEAKDWGELPAKLLDDQVFNVDVGGKACDLPFVPAAKAKKGDWTALHVELNAGERKESRALKLVVTDVGADAIALDWSPVPGSAESVEKLSLDAKRPPHALLFVSMIAKGGTTKTRDDADEAVRGVKMADEKKTVGGREFACRKISFKTLGGGVEFVTLWVSEDVRGLGLVALEAKLAAPRGQESGKLVIEVAGFGSGEKAEWGKTAEEVGKK